MKKYPILMALAIIFTFVLTFSIDAGQVYTWTDEHGNLHITNSPPPKNAKIKELPVQSGEMPITHADISKANKLLGYTPKVMIETGIDNFIQWYKQSGK